MRGPANDIGHGSLRPEEHRLRNRLSATLALIGLLAVGLGVGTVLTYSFVKTQATQLETQLTTHLQEGQGQLEAAKASLIVANSNRDESRIEESKVQFLAAKGQFLLADQIVGSSQLLTNLEYLPFVSDSVRSRVTAVNAISAMGVDISNAGLTLATLDGQLINPKPVGSQQGKSLLTVLGQTKTSLAAVKVQLVRAQQDAARVDIRVLPHAQQGAFAKARATIALGIGGIDEFEKLVPTITALLGGSGARNYLIEQVNPAELRAGGGFIGTYSVVRANAGAVSLVASGPATDITPVPRPSVGQPGYVAPPGPLREFLPVTTWSFLDSNFFADFPTNATTAETFVQPRLRFKIDGVVSIDYYTVAKMLEVTGPLSVPGYSLKVDSNNFISTMIQYDLAAYTDLKAEAIHKAILSAVAGPLMDRISTLPPDHWPALLSALNDLATSRHLQVYFNDSSVETQMEQFGWTGTLKLSTARGYMMEVESNFGGTKANYFITRHYTIELTRFGNVVHHKLTVDITDNMPYSYRPNEFYRAYIRLYVDDRATNASNDLVPPRYANPSPPAGTRMLDGWMNIHGYGHDRLVTFQWDTPFQPNGRGVEQIYWQKQPGTSSDAVKVVWHDGEGHTYQASGELSQDLMITLGPSAVTVLHGQVGTAQLPSLSLG